MDYRTYRFCFGEKLRYGLRSVLITGLIAFCFYDSFWGFVLLPAVTLFCFREKQAWLAGERRKELQLQFKDAVQAMAAAMAAGYSPENAVSEAGRDLRLIYPERADMIQELSAMQRRMEANQTVEEAIREFASRSGLEEAETFGEIFAAAKRNGGDLIGIMGDTARTIGQTVETERQVASALAARRYEQKIMNGIPFVMVLYLRLGCPGFLDPVYHNMAGIGVMTVCLGVYFGARQLGRRILEIEV